MQVIRLNRVSGQGEIRQNETKLVFKPEPPESIVKCSAN